MQAMFYNTAAFNGDLSTWDVSSVQDVYGMFYKATAFNRDLSKWDVSSVQDMDSMFSYAISFEQKLCGAAWVHSKASKVGMFAGSSVSISPAVCAAAPTSTQ